MITRVQQAPLSLHSHPQSQPQPPSRDLQHKSEELTVVKSSENEDISQPISILLRKSTAKAHQEAERSKGAEWLVKGLLNKEEYVRFLMMLWRVYTALEDGLFKNQSNPVLKQSYQPDVLARADAISADIATLLNLDPTSTGPDSEWQTHPINLELARSPPTPLSHYLDRLRDLSVSTSINTSAPDSPQFHTSSLLLAHAYVRYLGDLSGGQYIRRRIAKVYNLSDAKDSIKGDGVRFYIFKNSDGEGDGEAGKADIQRLKDWFKSGMDAGVGDDSVLKEALIKEANLAFELNQELFTVLQGPSEPTQATDTITLPPPVKQPWSSTSSVSPISPTRPQTSIGALRGLVYTKYSWLSASALVLCCVYILAVQPSK